MNCLSNSSFFCLKFDEVMTPLSTSIIFQPLGKTSKLKALKQQLQNDIRSNPNLHLLAEDWNALSHNESEELKGILKPINVLKEKITDQEKVIRDLNKEKSKSKSTETLYRFSRDNCKCLERNISN